MGIQRYSIHTVMCLDNKGTFILNSDHEADKEQALTAHRQSEIEFLKSLEGRTFEDCIKLIIARLKVLK